MLDLVTLNTVLSTCARSQGDNSYQRAKDLLFDMKEAKYGSISPDVISFNNVLAACHDPIQCLNLIEEMRMSRKFQRFNFIEPSPVTYTNAIKACAVHMRSQRLVEVSKESTHHIELLNTSLNEKIVTKIYEYATSDKKVNYIVRSAYLHCIASFGNTKSIENSLLMYQSDGILGFNALFRSLSVIGIDGSEQYEGVMRATKIKQYYEHFRKLEIEPTDLTFRYLGRAIRTIDGEEQVKLVYVLLNDRKEELPGSFLDTCVRILLKHGDEKVTL